MTSNMSIEQVETLINNEGQSNPNIQITHIIGQSVEFLDVLLKNDNGHLKTTVFRKPASEPYVLPHLSDHPRHMHRNTPYTALLRAARICSDVQAFDEERLNIEIALLLNGYPASFITKQFAGFFEKNKAMSVYTTLNDEQYQLLHNKLLTDATRQSKQSQKRIMEVSEKIDKETLNKNEKIIMKPDHNVIKTDAEAAKKPANTKKMYLHYTF